MLAVTLALVTAAEMNPPGHFGYNTRTDQEWLRNLLGFPCCPQVTAARELLQLLLSWCFLAGSCPDVLMGISSDYVQFSLQLGFFSLKLFLSEWRDFGVSRRQFLFAEEHFNGYVRLQHQ